MNKQIICIACPRGCRLTIIGVPDPGGSQKVTGEKLSIEGNQCRKGVDYGRQEIIAPRRMLTTTVRTTNSDFPRLPVRLSAEIPKEQLFQCMKIINEVVVSTGCRPGDILMENIIEEGVNLIASGGLDFEG